MPKSKQSAVSYAAAADSNKKVKPSPPPPPGIQVANAGGGKVISTMKNEPTQPQSLAMDVQEPISANSKDAPVISALKLYETIELYKKASLQSKERAVLDVMKCFVDENKNGNVVSVFKTPDSSSVGRMRFGNGKSTTNQKLKTKRHIISGTGRVAYSGRLNQSSKEAVDEEFEVRVIYRLNKSDNSSNQTTAQSHMEWKDVKIGDDDNCTDCETVSPSNSSTITSAAQDTEGGVAATAKGLEALHVTSSTGNNGNNSSTSSSGSSVVSGVKSGGFGGSSSNGTSTTGVKAGKTGGSFFTASSRGSANGTSFVNTKAPGYQPQQQQSHGLGVGVTGRAAAMAKMSSLGEEWPEEEELPGFSSVKSSVNSASGAVKAGGGLSREMNKEVNKEAQRQQKLKSAKRG